MDGSIARQVNELRRNLRNMQNQHRNAVVKTIRWCLKDLLKKANKIVPLDKGDLRKSGKYEVIFKGSKVRGEVSYNTHYALIQHENLEFRHAPGRQAKYLEQPAKENAKFYSEKMKEKIKEVLGK